MDANTTARTEAALNAAKPQVRPYKLSDGERPNLRVTPAVGKLCRLAHRFGGKGKQLSRSHMTM